MNVFRSLAVLLPVLTLSGAAVRAQDGDTFDLQAYRAFLVAHKDLTAEGLGTLHPAGTFLRTVSLPSTQIAFYEQVDSVYQMTAYEKELLRKHHFMVSERLSQPSFGHALLEIYHADLPVYVSADAILHAFHMSYDALLMEVEEQILMRKVDTLLSRLHNAVPELRQKYSFIPGMIESLRDVDVYLTVPRRLLGNSIPPIFAENLETVQTLEGYIDGAQPVSTPIFGTTPRKYDFSQLVPRGHYTLTPELKQYFQAMMWLGRTELYLSAPRTAFVQPSDRDVQRQTIASVLLIEAMDNSSSWNLLAEIEDILKKFVGDQDNVTPLQLQSHILEDGLPGAWALADTARWRAFRDALLQHSFAAQRINSQILWSDPFDTFQIIPASAFFLLGQRFIVDSYVTGNVVYDRILYEGTKILRMLPSPLDVLFALGNDAAGQLLAPELEKYPYATNLAGLRYLIDGYEPAYWNQTMYTAWLDAIRALSPPAQRTGMPAFMQTAAWWQKGMNTQLASWAELRHDNLLYAKQSYSGGVICSFPESYVEPVPEFFQRMRVLADAGAEIFSTGSLSRISHVASFFRNMGSTMDTLGAIAGKERAGSPIDDAERSFLRRMLFKVPAGCTEIMEGWYVRLFYTGEVGAGKTDIVVADVHTAPTDASGSEVGWVLHCGTGPVNLAVLFAPCSDGTVNAFVGPVMSYYEYVSTNYKRLTDEEWKEEYQAVHAFRPSWVNLYLADASGNGRGEGLSLLTGIPGEGGQGSVSQQFVLAQNYPNPFNASTIIPFQVLNGTRPASVEITLFDVQGQQVRRLFTGEVPPGAYTVRWDGTNDAGRPAASGVFFYRLRADEYTTTRGLVLLR